jgi:hypothetical protein
MVGDNMEFLLGAAAMLLFFVVYEMGKRSVKQPAPQPAVEVDEEQLEKAKRIQAHFENLMSYDVEQAMKREW